VDDVPALYTTAKATAKDLRRLPADLRRALAADVQQAVAGPEAARVAGAWRGPWATQLAGATKARKLADPTIVVGGAKRVVRGGASARQLVYGENFGGGGRRRSVTRRKRHGGTVSFKRDTTAQFAARGSRTIFRQLDADTALILEGFAQSVDRVLDGLQG
jgi:hypothetical protein